MSSADQHGSQQPLPLDRLSVLRHELVTPINLIVGYCELLTAEAIDQGVLPRLAPLQTIRQLGFSILHAVDHILLTEISLRYLKDIQILGTELTSPTAELVQLCGELRSASEVDREIGDFAGDLARIHSAGMQLQQMAAAMACGAIDLVNQPQHQHPSES